MSDILSVNPVICKGDSVICRQQRNCTFLEYTLKETLAKNHANYYPKYGWLSSRMSYSPLISTVNVSWFFLFWILFSSFTTSVILIYEYVTKWIPLWTEMLAGALFWCDNPKKRQIIECIWFMIPKNCHQEIYEHNIFFLGTVEKWTEMKGLAILFLLLKEVACVCKYSWKCRFFWFVKKLKPVATF